MATTIEQVAANSQNIADSSDKATVYASNGEEAISNIRVKMDVIHKSTEDSSQVIQGLSNASSQITKIVELITQIADQTNLLALMLLLKRPGPGSKDEGLRWWLRK
ncbi:hypothetical protein N752_24925 [Desulforamulus aquiferis]|nr:methyl-accepting chemotaxis protein [Desulforamulus aquiferis]RYD02575.1 hypothetical protein N752_24925 [Desulforamulus aquiferis]